MSDVASLVARLRSAADGFNADNAPVPNILREAAAALEAAEARAVRAEKEHGDECYLARRAGEALSEALEARDAYKKALEELKSAALRAEDDPHKQNMLWTSYVIETCRAALAVSETTKEEM